MSPVLTKLGEFKGVIGGVLFALALLASLASTTQMPKKLDSHIRQMDETNHQLRVLVCLQARLDTPLRCIANTP